MLYKLRQEPCYGTPVCDYIAVDPLHSIRVRLTKLLMYLNETYPSDNGNTLLQ